MPPSLLCLFILSFSCFSLSLKTEMFCLLTLTLATFHTAKVRNCVLKVSALALWRLSGSKEANAPPSAVPRGFTYCHALPSSKRASCVIWTPEDGASGKRCVNGEGNKKRKEEKRKRTMRETRESVPCGLWDKDGRHTYTFPLGVQLLAESSKNTTWISLNLKGDGVGSHKLTVGRDSREGIAGFRE